MATVIDQILSIDAIAQKKLDEARELKARMREEIDAQIAQTAAAIARKTEEELQKLRQSEEEETQKAKRKINMKTEQAISQLERLYADTHADLEEKLFQNVIGTSL